MSTGFCMLGPTLALLLSVVAACGGPTQTRQPTTTGGAGTPSSASAAASSGETPAEQPSLGALPQRIELLGGRLRMRVPSEAKVQPRPHSIMAADTPNDEETRVVLVPGSGELARFVLLARESFAYGSGNIEADADKLLGKEASELSLSRASVGHGLTAIGLRPKTELGSHGALFVFGAVVERSDRSLCELSFYILPEMSSERRAWQAKAIEMLRTLEAGSGSLPGKREHRLDTGTGATLSVKLPRPALLTRQEGPDFYVYRLRELATVGESAAQLGIYFGDHPSHQYEQAGVDAAKVKKSAGTLLGKQVDWFTWTTEDGGTVSEAIAPIGQGYAHVFVTASGAKLGELRRAAEAMRLGREPSK